MTNQQVVERFAARTVNRRTGKVTAQGFSITADGNALKDRGWWPLAYYLGHRKSEGHLFLKQGDRYSISTSQHQGYVQRHCEGPTVSFTALQAAGLRAEDVKRPMLLDYTKDTTIHLERADKDAPWLREDDKVPYDKVQVPFVPPAVGMIVHCSETSAYWHILGAALFRVEQAGDKDKVARVRHLLASLDERMYFVAELPRAARTVGSAFKLLKPVPVQQAESQGVEVKRQGEWFFVPTPLTDKDLAFQCGMTTTNFRYYQTGYLALPDQRVNRDRAERNFHVTRWCEVNGVLYAKGRVSHRSGPSLDSRLTREHFTLTLGETWHRVYRNTERESWGQNGRVD